MLTSPWSLQYVGKYVLALALAAASGCASKSNAVEAEESIGQATMLKDRTIQMTLRAEGPRGAVGDGLLVLRPGDKNYEATIAHVGGLEPGQSKPVPPWPASR